MSRTRLAVGWLSLLLFVGPLSAATSDPLRLVPDQADLVITVERPGRIIDAVYSSNVLAQLRAFPAVREFYDSTNARRGEQLLAFVEKQLGAGRRELFERVAGDGMVFAAKFGGKGAVEFVVQARDEALLRRFVVLGLDVIGQELARQESKDKIEHGHYKDVETFRIGDKLHGAVVGTALVVSNLKQGVESAIDLHLSGGAKSVAHVASLGAARKLAGPEAVAWAWLNYETVRKAPGAKEAFKLPRADPQITVLFGSYLDVAARSAFLGGGLYLHPDGFTVCVRMPAGRAGMNPALAAFLPPPGQPGSRPLLEPTGVLFSSSNYYDIAEFWKQRQKLFTDKQNKIFEDFDQKSKAVLAGAPFSKFVEEAGPYHRFVVVHQSASGYTKKSQQYTPGFGLVIEMRDPEAFGKRMEATLRAGALLASTQVSLKSADEMRAGHKIIGYRFPEDGTLKIDTQNIRFNFSPCFALVGKQFVAASTIELCRELVDLLDREAKAPAPSVPAAERMQLYASGGLALLEAFKDQVATQTILDQAVPPESAKEQVKALGDLLRGLGVFRIEANYRDHDFHYDLRFQTQK